MAAGLRSGPTNRRTDESSGWRVVGPPNCWSKRSGTILFPGAAQQIARSARVVVHAQGAIGHGLVDVRIVLDDRSDAVAVDHERERVADDFREIILPLLSGQNRQTRLRTYRLWPDIQVSTLGSNWREQVCGWSEEARADFVSELLHHRVDDEIAVFAVEDNSAAVTSLSY